MVQTAIVNFSYMTRYLVLVWKCESDFSPPPSMMSVCGRAFHWKNTFTYNVYVMFWNSIRPHQWFFSMIGVFGVEGLEGEFIHILKNILSLQYEGKKGHAPNNFKRSCSIISNIRWLVQLLPIDTSILILYSLSTYLLSTGKI